MASIFISDVFSSMLIPAFWIALIYLAFFFTIKRISSRDLDAQTEQGRRDAVSSRRILDERYAKGEIRTEEYEETKNGLLGKKTKKKRKEQKEEGKNSTKRRSDLHKFD